MVYHYVVETPRDRGRMGAMANASLKNPIFFRHVMLADMEDGGQKSDVVWNSHGVEYGQPMRRMFRSRTVVKTWWR